MGMNKQHGLCAAIQGCNAAPRQRGRPVSFRTSSHRPHTHARVPTLTVLQLQYIATALIKRDSQLLREPQTRGCPQAVGNTVTRAHNAAGAGIICPSAHPYCDSEQDISASLWRRGPSELGTGFEICRISRSAIRAEGLGPRRQARMWRGSKPGDVAGIRWLPNRKHEESW